MYQVPFLYVECGQGLPFDLLHIRYTKLSCY